MAEEVNDESAISLQLLSEEEHEEELEDSLLDCSTSSYSAASTSSSILDRLKSPSPAGISRKRKMKRNPPPKGKRPFRGSSVSDPKHVDPGKRE